MRDNLAELTGRHRFIATVGRFGEKKDWNGYPEETILLKDIRLAKDNRRVTDHLWFTVGDAFFGLKVGDRFAFDARARAYIKGYEKDTLDYKLAYPSKVEILA